MVGLIKDVLDALKLGPRYLAAPVALVATAMLFLGDQSLERIGLLELTKNYRPVVGLFFLLAWTILLIDVFTRIFAVTRGAWCQRSLNREMTYRLHRLTEYEKQILRYYISKQTRTNYLHIEDGIVQGLVSEGIIELASGVGDVLDGFAYNISKFAWEYLNENKSLLAGTTNTSRTDKTRHPWETKPA